LTHSSGQPGPGRALDLACGAGRDARWLAAGGWQVVAVDRDASAIASLQGIPGIDARVMDLEREPITPLGQFDFIVVWHYYQPSLFPSIRRQLRPGGALAMSAKLTGRFAASLAELQAAFHDWTVVHAIEANGFAELLVQRP
jgi:SAM-dependent methyltransferase